MSNQDSRSSDLHKTSPLPSPLFPIFGFLTQRQLVRSLNKTYNARGGEESDIRLPRAVPQISPALHWLVRGIVTLACLLGEILESNSSNWDPLETLEAACCPVCGGWRRPGGGIIFNFLPANCYSEELQSLPD